MKIETKLTITLLVVLAVVIAGLLFIFSQFFPYFPPISWPSKPTVKGIEKFKSVEDFRTYLEEGKFAYFMPGFAARARALEVPLAAPLAVEKAPVRVSETTVQVPGIDEPDIVKTDGNKIYFSREGYYYWRFFEEMIPPKIVGETKIIKVFPPEKLDVLGKIEKTGDLLLKDNILVIFAKKEIFGYDISNPKSPKKIWEVKFKDNGFLIGARLFKDKIYFVTKNRVDEFEPCPIKPLEIEGKPLIVECTQIYHPIVKIPVDVTYNAFILDPLSGKIEKNISFVGSTADSIIYMSENGLYITYSYYGDFIEFFYNFLLENEDLFPDWVIEKIKKLKDYEISDQAKFIELGIILERYKRGLPKDERKRVENEMENRMTRYFREKKRELEKTGIVKIGLKDFEILATGEVPGRPLNQFSLDEYKGNLRVAVTVGERFWIFGFWGREESANDVYVLDKNLKILGSVKDLGITERIFSVRFIEDKGYVVTFRIVDPFYVLDLSNSKRPKLEGELKIPGYSSYLHQIEKDKILGIGKEGWKVKISLFDVSDPREPKELDKYILDESWSDILETHHAFLQDKKHQIFFLPASKGGYIFSYKGEKLELKRVVSDVFAKRAVYIDDYLYIVGQNKLVVLNELNWEKVNEIEY